MTPRIAILAGVAALLALAIATELLARRPGASLRPLGATLAAALRTPGGRIAVFGAWLWLGWHFLAR